MKRRAFILNGIFISGGALSLFVPAAFAQVNSMGEAINKSGRQRMLAQRLAKAYMQIGLGVETTRSKKILEQSLALFDRQLVELLVYAPSIECKKTLQNLAIIWLDYKQVLVGKNPNRDDAKIVISLSEEVARLADTATNYLEKIAGNPGSTLVNLAGRQRMLSQRMAKYYQAGLWEVAPSDAREILASSRNEFVKAMQTLNKAATGTPKLKEELLLAQQQWLFFDDALHQAGDLGFRKKFTSVNIASTSERILEQMDKVTNLVQQNLV